MFLLRLLVKCRGCGDEATILTGPPEMMRGFVPTLPNGWNEGERGNFYCPKHTVTVTITVDGLTV